VADGDADAASLAGLPENAPLLDLLRGSAEPARSEYRLGAWELHAHPDLCGRLDDVAGDAPRVELFGLPGLVARSGVVYAIARGTGTLLLRVPAGPIREEILDNGGGPAVELGPEWVSADAWLTDTPRAAGTALLARWLEAARSAADA
jgi:hypothetical protein